MKVWELRERGGIDALVRAQRPDPEPGPGEVLVRLRASCMNYRDLSVVLDPVSRGFELPLVPNSDGAGVVEAVGSGVTRFKPGDTVATLFFQTWMDGEIPADALSNTLGAPLPGCLADTIVLPETGVIGYPGHLSFEEAATLPCAALTAWHALVATGGLKAGDSVLLLGTGGVSIFGLQFAKMFGARAIVTSGSDAKLERARALGADATINYRETVDWARAVLDLTDGRGVDNVLEVGGAGTFEKSLAAVRVGGRVSLIGILTGTRGQVNPLSIMRKSLTVRGIYNGSRAMFEAMNRAMAQHGTKPVVDHIVGFDSAPEAFGAMQAAEHFGKIAIRI